MNTARKGAEAERRSRAHLEEQGYYVMRSARSAGLWDLAAFKPDHTLLVQVKVRSWPGASEMRALAAFACPDNVHKVVHRWRARQTVPDVRVVEQECAGD